MLNRSAILVTALLYENVPKEDVTRLCENEMGITIVYFSNVQINNGRK